MSTIQEIEAAIRSLSPEQRENLAEDLPGLTPELDGDAANSTGSFPGDRSLP